MVPDTRLFAQFSRGLPEKTVASWEGRWLVRDFDNCIGSEDAMLRMPRFPAISSPAEVLPHAPLGQGMQEAAKMSVSMVAQLQSSVGYIHFSRPVILRSLLARWSPRYGSNQPPAIIAGRLGLDNSWTTHLDPTRGTKQWIDVTGNSLATVDEVVFVAAAGLEIGALEVSTHSGTGNYESRTVLMLSPTQQSENVTQPFRLHPQNLSPASMTYVSSLQEISEKDLQLALAGSGGQKDIASAAMIPGRSPTLGREDDPAWRKTVKAHSSVFEQRHLPRALHSVSGIAGSSPVEHMLSDAFQGKLKLPKDLLVSLSEHTDEILGAAVAWVDGGRKGRSSAPSFLPRDGSEGMIWRYVSAKTDQKHLDVLTTAFLYWMSAQ
jgi:hypothetical protein